MFRGKFDHHPVKQATKVGKSFTFSKVSLIDGLLATPSLAGVSLEHVVGFAPEMLDDLDNHLSTEGVEANAQTALAEERMDHFVEFENETMIAEEVGGI